MPTKVDLAAQRTQTMHFNMMFDLEPNIASIGNTDMWLTSQYTDSAALTVTTEHHAGKISLHRFDDMISYWEQNGRAGLEPIIRQKLAVSMTDHLELLARNAFLSGAYFKNYAGGTATGGADSFGDISQLDKFNYQWAANAQLRAMTLGLPGFEDGAGPMVALTTPATVYSFMTNSDWIGLNKYTEKGLSRVFTGEVGTLYGTKYIVSPINILWNAGRIAKQTTITASTPAGAGGANWGPYTVGQTGATKYITVADADGINIGDVVTIHSTRTSAYGVTNGVDPYAGKQFHRIVRSKSGNNIGFDRPLFWAFDTDLGSGVYGYVTKALHIHATIFVAGEGGVVCGVTQPPTLHIPPVIDDLEAMRRFSWDAYLKYQAFRVERFEVFFHAGEIAVQRGIQVGGEWN